MDNCPFCEQELIIDGDAFTEDHCQYCGAGAEEIDKVNTVRAEIVGLIKQAETDERLIDDLGILVDAQAATIAEARELVQKVQDCWGMPEMWQWGWTPIDDKIAGEVLAWLAATAPDESELFTRTIPARSLGSGKIDIKLYHGDTLISEEIREFNRPDESETK
jgi:hypothetical protein